MALIPATNTEGKLLTVEEVAERLRQSKATVYRKVYSGELGAVRLAKSGRGAVRVPEGELHDYIFGAPGDRETPLHDKELAR